MKDLPLFEDGAFVADSHSAYGALKKGIELVNYYVF
jgi:hypothetical protein